MSAPSDDNLIIVVLLLILLLRIFPLEVTKPNNKSLLPVILHLDELGI